MTLESKVPDALALSGLEPDNLLSFLAMLGLLRAIEVAKPGWSPRTSWLGPPWVARLHLDIDTEQGAVAEAAAEGLSLLAARLDVDGRKDVDFDREAYKRYALGLRERDRDMAAIPAALGAEFPERDSGRIPVSPLVMMFGQGHQHFLERLLSVIKGDLPGSLRKAKNPPDLRGPAKIRAALFEPWERTDATEAFRWDPEEDQRYALQFGNPSAAGAAPTVHGANRLAAAGFLSFACVPTSTRLLTPGARRVADGFVFLWPIVRSPTSLAGHEALLSSPDLFNERIERLLPLGVAELMKARRINNGKFLNVTRAVAITPSRPNAGGD